MSRVVVLAGGRSLERQVSLRSGGRVEDALERLGHEAIGLDADAGFVERLRDLEPDVAFIALHGCDGEDGTVQELLEAAGIPYTGSGPSACIRCSDKVLAKHLMQAAGIPTPDFFAFNETAFRELGAAAALPAISERLAYPIVVKPASQGSALGIRFVRSAEDFPGALLSAFSYDRKVLLERYVPGRDLAVSVIDGPDGEPVALPVVEAVTPQADFYDFEARYEIGRTRFACPADLPEALSERARSLAVDIYRVFGCRGVARVDMMLEEHGGGAAAADSPGRSGGAAASDLQVLEIEVVPGFTETSLLPQAADAAGLSFDEIVERILGRATVLA